MLVWNSTSVVSLDSRLGAFAEVAQLRSSLRNLSVWQVKDLLQPPYQIAAQNSWVRGVGAYTGEIAPELLADLGVTWVILGHSERRAIIGESDQLVRSTLSTVSRHLDVASCAGASFTGQSCLGS